MGGFVVGFATLWQLSLVILAIVPVLAAAGGVYAIVLTGLVAKGQAAYSGAGGVAEQMVSAVRTVRAPPPHSLTCSPSRLTFATPPLEGG